MFGFRRNLNCRTDRNFLLFAPIHHQIRLAQRLIRDISGGKCEILVPCNFSECIQRGEDVSFGSKTTHAKPYRTLGKCPEGMVGGRGAVQAGAGQNIKIMFKQCPDFFAGLVGNVERKYTQTIRWIFRAVHKDLGNIPQAFPKELH